MSIKLSRRLQAVADCVPLGARIIDVGTDHAMIPVWLTQTERIAHAWASDIRPGPLQSARRLIEETGCEDGVSLRLTNGLQGFSPEDGDTIVIAGMGGETMMNILSEAPWTKENALLILEPQSKQALLRRFLHDNGYAVKREFLVEDAGRIYPVMLICGGCEESYTPGELHVGHLDLIGGDPLLGEYLEGLMRRLAPAVGHDPEAAGLMAEFKTMKEMLI